MTHQERVHVGFLASIVIVLVVTLLIAAYWLIKNIIGPFVVQNRFIIGVVIIALCVYIAVIYILGYAVNDMGDDIEKWR